MEESLDYPVEISVTGIDSSHIDSDIRNHLETFGPLADYVFKKRYALAVYATVEGTKACLGHGETHQINGRPVTVRIATKQFVADAQEQYVRGQVQLSNIPSRMTHEGLMRIMRTKYGEVKDASIHYDVVTGVPLTAKVTFVEEMLANTLAERKYVALEGNISEASLVEKEKEKRGDKKRYKPAN